MGVKVITDHPFAYESLDHIEPKGARQDNTKHMGFVKRAMEVFGGPVQAIDLGCAGGGLVLNYLEAGNFAIGIDGADYGVKNKQGEWGTIPNFLFNADLTKPYKVVDEETGEPIGFDIVTAWEVMEHIKEEDLPQFMENIKNLFIDGDSVFVCSIAEFEDPGYHVTLRPYAWWKEKFESFGFRVIDGMFGPEHYVRWSSFYFTLALA